MYGETLLTAALQRNPINIGMIKELIKQGADVNINHFRGGAPIFIILSHFKINKKVIRILLKDGASVKVKNFYDETPLHIEV